MAPCRACDFNARDPAALPIRERIYDDGLWRVAHSFDSALAGWLVVLARRHITSLSQLTADEAAALGPLLQRLSAALESVTGAEKCYVMFFAEAADFSHLHIHIVPRPPDLPPDRRGPAIMAYIGRPEGERVAVEEMDALGERLRETLASSG